MLNESQHRSISFLEANTPFPPLSQAMGKHSSTPGLLAAGGGLSVQRLVEAYSQGIFPWYSQGQPVLWWSTDPRMVLLPDKFKVSASLKKRLKRFSKSPGCEIKMDSAFLTVIENCSGVEREGQGGTWITREMIHAYHQLHLAGYAHSVETWQDGVLVGGLYLVNLGRAVFGESMFTFQTDASKIALSALVAFAKHHQIELIDCQQKTAHLSSLGGETIDRADFLQKISPSLTQTSLPWIFKPIYWQELLSPTFPSSPS